MEDKILKELSIKLKKELEKIAAQELDESNKILAKAKKTSLDLINKMEEIYNEKTLQLEKEVGRTKILEEKLVKFENTFSNYKKVVDQIIENPKFAKKYL